MTHQHKGGMCTTCVHAHRDCSYLPFSTMPALARDAQTVIVRCTDFQRSNLRLTPPVTPGEHAGCNATDEVNH